MATPGDFAATVKQQADIVRIVGEYVKLRQRGGQNYVGLCPFHQEKTPSFSVHAGNQFFHCFGCNAGGDVFTFVQKIENITFPEAVRMVAEKLGIPMPKVTYSSPEEARQAKMRGGLLDIHERACAFFQEQLKRPEAAHAREYLHSRGLNPETIAEFRLGFAPERGFLLRDVLINQFDEELIRESGLFSWKEKDHSPESQPTIDNRQLTTAYSKFRNRVMFPIATEQGKVIAFTGRTLATDEKSGPKYLNSPETPIYSKSRVLFNLDKAKDAIRKLDYAILVEGQMDCITVYSAGLRNVIASSGTAFTDAQARLLARFSKKIVVNFDPDTAGAAAAERSLALLVSEDFEIKVLTLETGFDPDLYIRRKGANAYSDALAHSQKYFDYLIERARALHPVRTPEGKVKALNYLLPHIHRVPSRIVRDELANEISHRLGIESKVLRQELRHAATARSAARVNAPAASQLTGAERVLLRALASPDLGHSPFTAREGQDPDFEPGRQAHYFLSREQLHQGSGAQALFDALITAHEQGLDPMSLPLDESDRRLVASVLLEDNEELTPELLENAVRSLRKRTILRQLDDLQHQLKEAERRNDTAASAHLLRERVKLRRAMTAAGENPALST
ncbi:MAG TPA: DNA primase [Candidatus Eisenbacteria bacterium]|nr:DNA primase [Candidatus Eisenbacteria bacterium]